MRQDPKGLVRTLGVFSLAPGGQPSVTLVHDLLNVHRAHWTRRGHKRGQEGQTAVIGNLDFLFEQVGGPELHDIWLNIEPGADKDRLITDVKATRVHIMAWVEAREEIRQARARAEHVGTFGMLTVSFLTASTAAGIGLLIHNYASLRDRLSHFPVLRAIGLSLPRRSLRSPSSMAS
jgi:hypothetical protein